MKEKLPQHLILCQILLSYWICTVAEFLLALESGLQNLAVVIQNVGFGKVVKNNSAVKDIGFNDVPGDKFFLINIFFPEILKFPFNGEYFGASLH